MPDRKPVITHLPGVHRQGITEAACRLQVAGLIRYTHGHIAILNRQGLEAMVCGC